MVSFVATRPRVKSPTKNAMHFSWGPIPRGDVLFFDFALFHADFDKIAVGTGLVRTDKAKFPFAGEGVDCEHREQDGVVVIHPYPPAVPPDPFPVGRGVYSTLISIRSP